MALCDSVSRLAAGRNTLGVLLGENRRSWCSCSKPEQCPSGACKEKKKKPFWRALFSRKDKTEQDPYGKKPPLACCKVKYYSEEPKDPDLSAFGGRAYKTCGRAYVIQKDMLPERPCETSKEDVEIKRIEIHPDLKEFIDDPMPKFESVAQRMVEISNRRLHPLYEKYRNTPKLRSPLGKRCPTYRTVSGPIDLHDVPLNIKFNKKLLDRKNLYSEYKRVDPPRDMIGRLVEMKKNSQSLLQYARRETTRECKQAPVNREKRVFDTLNQDKKSC